MTFKTFSILGLVTIVWAMVAPAHAKCRPALVRSSEEIAVADRVSQADDWNGHAIVYLATASVVEGPPGPATPSAMPPDPDFQSHQVVLAADKVLKGALANDAGRMPFTATTVCGIRSDLAASQVGDQFIVYAGAAGPTSVSRVVALHRILDRGTLEAIAR